MVPVIAPPRAGVALLERSLAYTLGALSDLRDAEGSRPTPCARWDLTDLLVHVVDSLEVVTELALGRLARVGPPPSSHRPEVLADHVRVLGCTLLEQWTAREGDDRAVRVGGLEVDPGLAAEVGALEVAVHGWDLAAARGHPARLPSLLAAALLPVAVARVPADGRSARFAPPRPLSGGDPSSVLLAHLGRDPGWPDVTDSGT